jgi:low affinity Fe/Cu permease
MAKRSRPRSQHLFERISQRAAEFTGGSWAFVAAGGLILVWLISGPLFDFSNTWQLVINTGTTIITFLMVFLIQRSQNKDALAVQLKLNELVAAMKGASNRLIDIEDLGEDELAVLHIHYRKLAKMAEQDGHLASSHSVEEAEQRHARKHRAQGG